MVQLARLLFLFFMVLLSVATAATSELKLKNGDRISGELVRKSDGRIIFRSDIFGEIQVPEAQVASLETHSKAPDSKSTPGSPAGTQVAAAASPASTETTVKKHWHRILKETKGMMEFGFNDQTGRRKVADLSLRANAEYSEGVDSYRLNWRYFYGRSYGVLQTDRRDGSFRWRHDLKNTTFMQYVSSYSDDSIKEIDINLEQSVGLGWNALKRGHTILNVGGGGTVQYRKALGIEQGAVALVDVFEDYSWKLSERISFKQEASAQYSPAKRSSFTILNGQLIRAESGIMNYRFRFNLAAQGKISEHLALNLRYDYEYDNTIPIVDLKADQRISSTIGYMF